MCRQPLKPLSGHSDFTPFLARRVSHRVPEIAGGGTAGSTFVYRRGLGSLDLICLIWQGALVPG